MHYLPVVTLQQIPKGAKSRHQSAAPQSFVMAGFEWCDFHDVWHVKMEIALPNPKHKMSDFICFPRDFYHRYTDVFGGDIEDK
jgi:hypothetical protein